MKPGSKKTKSLMQIMLALILFGQSASLSAQQLSVLYGGRLVQTSGAPVKGPVDLQASFFHQETGGTAVGNIKINLSNVPLVEGVFQVELALTPEDLAVIFPAVSQKVYIEIENLSQGGIYPRQLYNITPYALRVPVDNKTITVNTKGELTLGSGVNLRAGTTSNYVSLKADPTSADGTTYTFPPAPIASKFLTTDGSGNLSWIDMVGGGSITGVTAGTGLTGGGTTGTVTLNVDVGTGANKIVQLDGTGKLPAVDGSALTGVTSATITGQGSLATLNAVSGGPAGTITDDTITNVDINSAAAIATSKLSGPVSAITGNGLGTAATQNVGVGAGNVVQLDGSGFLPALNGSALTTLDGANIATGTINSARIDWAIPGNIGTTAPATGTFTGVTSGTAGVSVQDNDGGANYVILKAPTVMAADQTYTLPAVADAGKYLTTDLLGNLSWATPTGAGDMLKATYDTNADNIVDVAATFTGQGALATLGAVSGGAAGTITDDTITNADINSAAAIATSKLSGSVTAITGNGLGALATVGAVSGGTGGTITDDTITNADVNASAAIATSKLSGAVTAISGNGLGTAATQNVGVGAGNVVQLDGSGFLPALNGSALTTLDGANIATGTINSARIDWASPGNIGTTAPATGTFTGVTSGTAGVSVQDNDGGANYVILKAPAVMAADQTYTLPAVADPGKYLTTDLLGNLSWATPTGAGDMLKATYDTNADNIVDVAATFTGQGALATLGAVSGGAAGTITDDTITNADINSAAAIATSKLSGAVTAITGNGLGALATADAVSGGAAGTITDDTITNADVNASAAIATSKLSGAVTAITGNGLGALATVGAVSGGTAGTITDDTITDADVNASAAIATSKLSGAVTAIAGNGLGTMATQNAASVAITGGSISGVTVSNFTSTGIDDNADAVAITIDVNERVGINQPTPLYKLDVLGSTTTEEGISYKDSDTGERVYVGESYSKKGLFGSNFNTSTSLSGLNANSTNSAFITANTIWHPTNKGDLDVVAGYYVPASMYGDINLWGGPEVGPALTIDGATSQVGIGTTSPNAKLDVRGRALFGPNGDWEIDSEGHLNWLTFLSLGWPMVQAGGINYVKSSDGQNHSIAVGSFTDGGVTLESGTLGVEIFSSTVSRVKMLDNGNFGIGTTNPLQKLSVAGSLGIIETGAGPSFYSIFQGGDQAGNITYTLPTAAPASDGYVLSATTAGTMSWSPAAAGDVTQTGTQTLTNKTLTAPIISTISNTGTLTLPTATDTLVGRATTDTLTNKTISGATNTITNIPLASAVTGTLPVANGGTGATTLTTNGVLLGAGTSAVSATIAGTNDQVLRIPGAGGAPAFGAIDVSKSAAVTGILAVANGGVGASLSATGGAGQYLKQSSSGAAVSVGTIPAADYPTMVGDSGAGGTQGAVPAPSVGDAAAGKFLKADGTWVTPSGTAAAGSTKQIQFNNGGAFGASANFTWDATSQYLGIGTSSPSKQIHIVKDGGQGIVQIDGYGGHARLIGRRATGTLGTPLQATIGTHFMEVSGRGYDGSAFPAGPTVGMYMSATQNQTAINQGTRISFETTLNNTTTTSEVMRIENNGFVGIGTTSPTSKLVVNGAARNETSIANGSSTIDFATSNLQYTTSDCGSYILHNLKDGGAYTFAVQGTTVALCDFTAYSDAGSTLLNVHLPPDHTTTTDAKHTLYNFVVFGTEVYTAWTPGY